MEKIPVHCNVYDVTFIVDSHDLTVVEADPEIFSILETNSLRDLCSLPTIPGRYRAELKFWFEDNVNADPYVCKFGFYVLKVRRLLSH